MKMRCTPAGCYKISKDVTWRATPFPALLADAAGELPGNHGPPLGAQLAHQLNDLGVLLHFQSRSQMTGCKLVLGVPLRQGSTLSHSVEASRLLQACGMATEYSAAHLRGPGAFDELWVEDLLPSVQALDVRPVLEMLSCRPGTASVFQQGFKSLLGTARG